MSADQDQKLALLVKAEDSLRSKCGFDLQYQILDDVSQGRTKWGPESIISPPGLLECPAKTI